MVTSAGVIITDGENILGCIPFGRGKKIENGLDIPKGHIEEGESPLDAAIRECREETGIVFNPSRLEDLGLFNYKPQKNLHVFLAKMPMPEVSSLKCTSYMDMYGKKVPEMIGYKIVPLTEISKFFFKDLVKILLGVLDTTTS